MFPTIFLNLFSGAPAPPPPPPMMSGGGAPPPPPPLGGGRADLLSQIQGGKALKKVDTNSDRNGSGDGRTNLLSDIRSGVKLKSVSVLCYLYNYLCNKIIDRPRTLSDPFLKLSDEETKAPNILPDRRKTND